MYRVKFYTELEFLINTDDLKIFDSMKRDARGKTNDF